MILRVVDSGLRRPTWQLAASAALAELHTAGATPPTLRLQLLPPSVLVGRHQVLERVVDTAWCREHGVAVARRVTGGGAIIMAPGIVGWELLLPAGLFPGGLGEAVERMCTAAAAGLSRLGVAARFQPRNDIVVNGRKISGSGGWFDGGTLLYQGTLLVTLDRRLIPALRRPDEKLERHGVASIADRVTDLESALGRPLAMVDAVGALVDGLASGLGLLPEPGSLTPAEEALADALERVEIGTPAFIAGPELPSGDDVLRHARRTPGGLIEAYLKPRPDGTIDSVLFTGDGFVNPPRALADLEAALAGTPLAAAADRARALLAASGATFLGCTPEDMAACVAALAEQHAGRVTGPV